MSGQLVDPCEIALTIKTLAMLLAQDSRNTQYRVKHLSHMQPRPQLQHNTTQEPLHLRSSKIAHLKNTRSAVCTRRLKPTQDGFKLALHCVDRISLAHTAPNNNDVNNLEDFRIYGRVYNDCHANGNTVQSQVASPEAADLGIN